jgi:hypothetical protein
LWWATWNLVRHLKCSISSCSTLSKKIKKLNFLQPKYYEGSIKRMLEILGDCKRTGCTFLVGGRNVDGVFKVWPKH